MVAPSEIPLHLTLVPLFPINLDDAYKTPTNDSDQENFIECEVDYAEFLFIYVNDRTVIDHNPVYPSLIRLGRTGLRVRKSEVHIYWE